MLEIPLCMNCKYGKIEEDIIICKIYIKVQENIANGRNLCPFYKKISQDI